MTKHQLANLTFYEKDPYPSDLFSDNARNDYSDVCKLANLKNPLNELAQSSSDLNDPQRFLAMQYLIQDSLRDHCCK